MYISYSGRKAYLTCPSMYEHRYVKKTPVVRDPRGALFGSCIGKVFEWFYTRRLWKAPDPSRACLSCIDEAVHTVAKDESFDLSADPPVRDGLVASLQRYIPPGVDMIRSHRFLTPMSRAEVDLTVVYSDKASGVTVKIGGRADFVHGRSTEDMFILDGKASLHRDKYIDPEQLVWYATQHYLKYHVMPSRLGFVFWSFPEDPVGWVEFGPDDIRRSLSKTVESVQRINLRQFDPRPSSACKMCDYRQHCPVGTEWMGRRRLETGGKVEESAFDIEFVGVR